MIHYYKIGYCSQLENIATQGGKLKKITFPALSVYFSRLQILFDTGYAQHFFDATKNFPERFYSLITPVTLSKQSLSEQLSQKPVKRIFLSHMHADHISGLKDFPSAQFICSSLAYQSIIKKTCRIDKLRQGLLPGLLPDNFHQRVHFIEDFPYVDLPKELHPFYKGYQLEEDTFAIELPGHAAGHYGLYLHQENVFLIADAVWQFSAISRNRHPAHITRLLMYDWHTYHNTINQLKILHHNNPTLLMVPSHCQKSIAYAENRRNHAYL